MADLAAAVAELQQAVAELKQRNERKDFEKRWEVGPARTLLIIALTYGCLFCYMWLVNMEAALLSAVVPTVGYALSTLAFPGARDRWGGI